MSKFNTGTGEIMLHEILGGTLKAAYEANSLIAYSTEQFINTVGLEDEGKVRTTDLVYEKLSEDEDAMPIIETIKMKIPTLAITAIPTLQINRADFEFCVNMIDINKGDQDKMPIGIVAAVTTFKNNIRNTDVVPKCNIRLSATQTQMPEGISRLLDILNAAIIPQRIGTTPLDKNYNHLSETAQLDYQKELLLKNLIKNKKNTLNFLEQKKADLVQMLQVKIECSKVLEEEKTNFDIKAFFEEETIGIKPYIKKLELILGKSYTEQDMIRLHEYGYKLSKAIGKMSANLEKQQLKLENLKLEAILKENNTKDWFDE